jgi:hypothetical protein
MFSIDPAVPEALTADELASVLRHQLDTPLEIDLDEAKAPEGAAHAGRITFGELLRATHPPLDLLERVRHFAKACKSRPDGPLPREVATALYFAAIVKAMLSCGTRTTALPDEALKSGVRWTLAQPWVPPELRALLEEGRAQLESA